MSTSTRVVFAALATFFIVFPLTVQKPGMPMVLKADEPAYYLAALSIAHDFDLVCGPEDIRRIAAEFPYEEVSNLILMSRDGWKTIYFGKPYLISLLAAPLTALFGADGFVATNMALLFLAIWLGARYLRRFNPEWLALLFAAGFFLLSNVWSYVFWMHSEVLCVAGVTASLYLGLTQGAAWPTPGRTGRLIFRIWNPATRPVWSGAALIVAAYNKPQLLLLGLPALFLAFRSRGSRGAVTWIAGLCAAGALACAVSFAWTGQANAYLGADRAGFRVDDFERMPDLPRSLEAGAGAAESPDTPRNSWGWIFGPPEIDRRLPSNLLYFFVGRHTGLFLYAPLTLFCIGLFLAFSRRSAERWILVSALAGVALFSLLWIPFNYHGGAGFIGNRYFVNALPGFLFLVTRIAPAWLPVAGFALAGVFVGPICFSPYGAVVLQPTLQAHTRNRPFRYFPLEHTLVGRIPGYRGTNELDAWWHGRDDLFHPLGDSFWVAGGQPVEIHVQTATPFRRPVFEVETNVAPNRIRLSIDGDSKRLDFAADVPAPPERVTLSPSGSAAVRAWDGGNYFAYTLWIESDTQAWRAHRQHAKAAADDQQLAEAYYLVGAIVTYLGEEAELGSDVYSVDWEGTKAPSQATAGEVLNLPVRAVNTSAGTWRRKGAARVDLSYHWRTSEGGVVVHEGLRSLLPKDVAPGETVECEMQIAAPESPGEYLLEIDPVRERIAWFSERQPASTLRLPVRVVAAGS